MTNTSGPTVRYDTRSAAIVIDRLTIRDAPVVAECRHWANGSRGPAATDADLAECDLAPFVERALAIGADTLGTAGTAHPPADLITLAEDVERQTTVVLDDAVRATKAITAAASEAMAHASDQAREAIEVAASAMRDNFTQDVTTACRAVTDEIRHLVGGDHPDVVATLHTELERFGQHLDQRAASRAIQLLAIVTRLFDPADPTSPLARQNAELERQRTALADPVATNVTRLQQKVAALTSAIRTDRETVNAWARQPDPAPDSHVRRRDPPPVGRDHGRGRRRVLRHLRVDEGSGPEQDGDGVQPADGSTTGIGRPSTTDTKGPIMRVPHTIRPALALAAAGLLVLAGCSSTPDAVANPANGGHPVTTTISVVHTVAATQEPATATQLVTAPAETVTVTVTETETSEPEPVPSEEPPTGLTVGGAGVTASNDGGSATIKVLSVKRVTKGFGDYGDPPKYGNYLLIDVSYECTKGTFDYNAFDWTVRDPQGRAYDEGGGFVSGYDGPELHSGTLGKGSKARGTLVVDAPKGALTLEYAPFLSAPAIWDIPA